MADKKQKTKNSYLDSAEKKQERLDRYAPDSGSNSDTNSTTSSRTPRIPRKGNRKKPS